jgi:hypothetical protein
MTPMRLADRRAVAAQRMAAMRISPSAADAADEASVPLGDRIAGTVAHHLAMQAQDLPSGLWSVGLRTGATRAEVEAAIAARLVTRSWPMRGTLHLLATPDVRWMCRLLAAEMTTTERSRHTRLGLTPATLDRTREVLSDVLRGGVVMPRHEVLETLRAHGVDPSGQRGPHLLGRLCQEALLCQGPLVGGQPTFVLLEEWVPCSWDPGREEAMAALATRYVASHGPVTERDLAGWVGKGLTFTREAVALAGPTVTTTEIGGQAYLVSPDAPAPNLTAAVRLLPGFDEYVLGYKDRSAMLTPAEELRVVPGKNGMFLGTVVVGGLVVGTWNRRTTTRGTLVRVAPFAPLSPARRRSVERAAAGYGRFLGTEVQVAYADA